MKRKPYHTGKTIDLLQVTGKFLTCLKHGSKPLVVLKEPEQSMSNAMYDYLAIGVALVW